MENKVLYLVPSVKAWENVKRCCPYAKVMGPDIDLDTVDVTRVSVVLLGGIDFISQMAGRLAARYMNEEASFTYIIQPRLACRIGDIEAVFTNAGLAGKYELRIPQDGYVNEIALIATMPLLR